MLALQRVSVSIGCCFEVGVMESNGMIVVAKLVEMDEVVELWGVGTDAQVVTDGSSVV